jgi:hypothetical protein
MEGKLDAELVDKQAAELVDKQVVELEGKQDGNDKEGHYEVVYYDNYMVDKLEAGQEGSNYVVA